MEPTLFVCSTDAEAIRTVREVVGAPVGVLVRPEHPRTKEGEANFKLHIDGLVSLNPAAPVVVLPRNPSDPAPQLIATVERVAAWHASTVACLPVTLDGIEAAHMLARAGRSLGVYPVTTPAVAAAFRDALIDAHHGQLIAVVPVGALYRAGYNGFTHCALIREVLSGAHVPVTLVALVETATEFAFARREGLSVAAAPDLIVSLGSVDAGDGALLNQGVPPEPVVDSVAGSHSYAISSPLIDSLLGTLDIA